MSTNKWYIRIICILLLLILALQIYLIRNEKEYQRHDMVNIGVIFDRIDHLTSTVYRLEDKIDAVSEVVGGADKVVSPAE